MSNHFLAFGLCIRSDFSLPLPPCARESAPDVRICQSALPPSAPFEQRGGDILLSIPEAGRMCIRGGREILVDPAPSLSPEELGVYLLGSCMGAILHQRGCMPLHGSCVARGGRAILLTGESGAGKSTLAREFIANGWQLLTDDVAAVIEQDGAFVVQSSYPSQKLWQDAMERYALSGSRLYREDERDKYGVDASSFYREGRVPLTMAVRLAIGERLQCSPIEGFAKADQLLRGTYRPYMIAPENRQRHFQRCVTLSGRLPMLLAVRERNADCAAALYAHIDHFATEVL